MDDGSKPDGIAKETGFAPYFGSRRYIVSVQALLLIEAVPATSLPLWWGELQRERGFTLVDFGIAQTASAVGGMLAGFILAAIIAKVDRRYTLTALLGIYAAALLAIMLTGSAMAAALLWGVAFFSMTGIESLGLAYLGYSPSVQRNNGIYVTVQTLMFGIAPLLVPLLMLWIGLSGVLMLFIVALLGAIPLVLQLPGYLPQLAAPVEAAARTPASRAAIVAAVCATVGYAVFAWYTVTLFNFSEQFGQARGVDPASIGLFLGIAGFMGIPGSLMAAYGERWLGRVWPVIGGTTLFVLACVLLGSGGSGMEGFIAGLILSSFSWSLLMAYVLSIMARIDPQGRVLAASYTVKGVLGVLLAAGNAAAIANNGLAAVVWICGACALVTLVAYLAAERLGDRSIA